MTDSAPKTTMALFPGRFPRKPRMCSSNIRMQTFTKNWSVKGPAMPREMEDAEFYYLSDSDRVNCFYCAGGLKNWKLGNPWYEHAK